MKLFLLIMKYHVEIRKTMPVLTQLKLSSLCSLDNFCLQMMNEDSQAIYSRNKIHDVLTVSVSKHFTFEY